MMSEIQDGIVATSPASCASGIDFGCGAQSSRPVGTFSSAPGAGSLSIELREELFGQLHRTSSASGDPFYSRPQFAAPPPPHPPPAAVSHSDFRYSMSSRFWRSLRFRLKVRL